MLDKVLRAWRSGSLWPRARRFLAMRLWRPVEVTAGYGRLRRAERRRVDLEAGVADHRATARQARCGTGDLRRLVAAYKAAKAAQTGAPAAHQVRGIWAEFLATNFRELVAAVEDEDLELLGRQLENLFRERFSDGMGGAEWARYRSLFGRFYIVYVWNAYFRRLEDLGFDPARDRLAFPFIGNPAGGAWRGHVLTLETLRHAYHAMEIAELLRGLERPVIAEIGGGLGGQAFQVLDRVPAARYRIFDLPEVAILSGYFLLSAFPGRVRLYGEGQVAGEDYAIGVFPHWTVDELAAGSVDLFYNSTSFSEMDGRSARAYLETIERCGRRYFMHDNHDERLTFRSPDGSISTNALGSELVPGRAFKRLYKKPRVHRLPEDLGIRHFEYLYERV